MSEFIQSGPQLKNEYIPLLKFILQTKLPKKVFAEVNKDVETFARRCVDEVQSLGEMALRNPPTHIPYSPWGKRIDEIRVSDGWVKLHAVAAEEGLIALGYEGKEHSRLHQYAKLFLYHPSSAFYSCPLAMTDGAAKIIQTQAEAKLKKRVLSHLTTRDAQQFWTSGQWMTEKEGGSDVSNTSTTAMADGEEFLLTGTKWFSSATTSEMALALARSEAGVEGSRGLSLFYIEMRDHNHQLNGIKIRRLKDKLGTRALPTAELDLVNCRAHMIGEPGHGVKNIATMLNITRLHNAICSCGQMNRSLHLAMDYAGKRQAFGGKVAHHSLQKQTFARMNLKLSLGLSLVMSLVELYGRDEKSNLSEDEQLLMRLMIPVAKLQTAKWAVEVASECVEAFGGAGYIEDTGIPLQLRDAQVFSIWEGTTNVLSLDVLRVLQKNPQALKSFFIKMKRVPEIRGIPETLAKSFKEKVNVFEQSVLDLISKPEDLESAAADLAQRLALYYGTSELIEVLSHTQEGTVRATTELALSLLTPLVKNDYSSSSRQIIDESLRLVSRN